MSAYIETNRGCLKQLTRCSFSENIIVDSSGEIRVVHPLHIAQDKPDERLIESLFYSNSRSTPEGRGLKLLFPVSRVFFAFQPAARV